MIKNSVIAASLFVASVSFANAAVTNGSLNFNWQGVIPADPITTGDWKFTDALGADYVPTTQMLTFQKSPDKSMLANSASNVSFFINSNTTELNKVSVYLGSNPISSGLEGSKQLTLATTTTPTNDQISIVMNGLPLQVGSAKTVDLAGVAGNQALIELSVSAKIGETSYKPGSSVSFSAPIIFAVDLK